jgi:GntR family transcriptional regulator
MYSEPYESHSSSKGEERLGTHSSVIVRESPIPLHHQFRTYLLDQIEQGQLQPGQQLPGEREYAMRFGISLAPIRQAILDLVKEGYLYRVRGRGTFVCESKVEEKIAILSSFTASMRAKGLDAELRILRQELASAPPQVRRALCLPSDSVFLLQRLALVDGEPLALLAAYLPPHLFPELPHLALEGRSLYATLEEQYGVVPFRAESIIEVIRCRRVESALLRVPAGTPLLQVDGTTYDMAERPIEYSRVLYRADRFRFTIESFRRNDRVLHLIGAPERNEKGIPS